MKFLICIVLLLLSYSVLAKDKEKLSKKFQDTLTMIIEDVESVLDPNWFVVRNDTGFSVYYCRTCQEDYESYDEFLIDSLYQIHHGKPSRELTDSFFELYTYHPGRFDFLTHFGPDSVHFRNNVSMVRTPYNDQRTSKQKYPKNGILKFDVYFQYQWTEEKIDAIQSMNDSIKTCILENYSKIDIRSFYDYRYSIETFYERCLYEGIYPMQRLPYHSSWYNYSIFIAHHEKFGHPYFIDYETSDSTLSDNNNLNPLLDRTLKSLAFTLGIDDFTTLEEHHQNRISNSKDHRKNFN